MHPSLNTILEKSLVRVSRSFSPPQVFQEVSLDIVLSISGRPHCEQSLTASHLPHPQPSLVLSHSLSRISEVPPVLNPGAGFGF